MDTDIAIAGGGPAGLAAAIAARQRGFRVTLFDGRAPPADKACGEGLMPDALSALAQLGIEISAGDSFTFDGIRFLDGEAAVAAKFPSGPGKGVRRTTLHRILTERAASLGVQLRWGAHVNPDDLRCKWIIGADGENSTVRNWAGLDQRVRERHRFGFRRHYRVCPWTDLVEIYWGKGYQVYVTPVASDLVCIAVLSSSRELHLDKTLQNFPELARRLEASAIESRERGAVSASRRLSAVYRDRVALIGDASGSVDGITGLGLCLAFRQAIALGGALGQDNLAEYQRMHNRVMRRPREMAKLLLALGANGSLRGAAMRILAAQPWIFKKFVGFHVSGPMSR